MTSTETATQNGQQIFDVAVIGAGFSGVGTAIRLRQAGIENFVVLEQRDGVGGTWRDNTYPGLACDVPAMLYSFSFELKTDWSHKFPEQPEILEYIEHCADKYGVRDNIRLNTAVDHASFDEAAGLWRVKTEAGDTVTARALVSGTGQLNRPKIANIPGRDDFEGVSFHSARWDHSVDMAGKRVASIGNGASAIQFVPKLAEVADRVSVFQRTANWMMERGDRPYTRFEGWLFEHAPFAARLVRIYYYFKYEARWPVIGKAGGWFSSIFERMAKRWMRKQVDDPEVREAITPDYAAGCKRFLISDDYYEALNRDNVELVTDDIERISRNGIVTADGREREFDVIVYATGFHSHDFVSPVQIYGKGGLDLNGQAWAERAEAYHGLTLPGFPNFFLLYGPNTNLGHNSMIFMLEQQIDYIVACVKRLRDENLKYLELTEDAMQAWREDCYGALDNTVWASFCDSWYKTADGKITNNWPYSTITYWWRLRQPRWADYRQVPHDPDVMQAPQQAEAA